jgi:hypothetical protein
MEMASSARRGFHELLVGAQDDLVALQAKLGALRDCALPESATPIGQARRLYHQRRRRERFFPSELFGEPGWDLLLDLYVARAEGRSVSTSSACIGAAVPQTTGLRWLTILEEMGLLLRTPSAGDERMRMVTLADEAFTRMTELFRHSA